MACAWGEDPPFIFVHIPKTGGTSFMSNRSIATKEIKEACPSITISTGHKTLTHLSKKLDISKYFKFSIVRNPFDRFVSLWKVQQLSTGIGFNTFINLVHQRKYGWSAIKTQTFWISDHKGSILTDHLIRFENYKQGIKSVLNKLSLPTPNLPHLRKLKRLGNYKAYYKTSQQVRKVSDIYSDDLKNFGYSF